MVIKRDFRTLAPATQAELRRIAVAMVRAGRDCRAIGGQAAAATLGSASFAAKKRCPKLAPSVPL